MASTETTNKFGALGDTKEDTLISQGLSLNMRDINLKLAEMFRLYQMVLGRILNGGLIGKSQVKYTYDDASGTYKEYDKGQIKFKDGIDNLRYLLDHRDEVSKAIGAKTNDIYQSRRDLGKVKEYIAKLQSKCELGDYSLPMQMYISKHDENIGGLVSELDWVAYILQDTWIDELVQTTAFGIQAGKSIPFSVEYLSDIVGGLVKDHEIDYHLNLQEFNANDYLDKGRTIEEMEDKADQFRRTATPVDGMADAVNMLNSMGKLDYGFYEMFKPIGGGNGKYIKVKANTDGTVDISGVAALSDMEHWEWEYGSQEYLRSLNTGNQRYLLKLALPWNDLSDDNPRGSNLWWKPDKPEELKPLLQDGDVDGDSEPQYRYYKPYETERFLRWFGTTYIPILDIDHIEKATVCSAPHLDNDTESDTFHRDATNIAANGMDLSRANIDESTSISLLSLQPKATVKVVNLMDETHQGQYLEFVVTGHRQTNVLSFNVKGKVYNSIQEMNHYSRTWERLVWLYEKVACDIHFLNVCKVVIGSLEDDWKNKNDNQEQTVVPAQCEALLETLSALRKNANQIDILRLRQVDVEVVYEWLQAQIEPIMSFIRTYDKAVYGYEELYGYITEYDKRGEYDVEQIGSEKTELLDIPLALIYDDLSQREILSEQQIAEIEGRIERYKVSFDDMTVDELRERITTFNNLIVRLPVDTELNCATSKRIFQDWKAFVDGATNQMVENGIVYQDPDTSPEKKAELEGKLLYVRYDEPDKPKTTNGLGSDFKEHKFIELYIDDTRTIPFIDYSWLYDPDEPDGPDRPKTDENGKPIGDRWDYWTDDDFNWPQ